MHVLTVLGARPQFIKAAPVSRALREAGARPGATPIRESIVHTGQHFDANMSQVFFDDMGIPAPAHHLGVGGLSHGAMTGRMLEGIEAILLADRPDWVLVYGDTNSTLAGALAAAKLGIPVAHVEAGLRSFNPAMPEEINRILTDRVSALLCCPTDAAIANLTAEGFPHPVPGRPTQRFENVGDVMYDAALHFGAVARERIALATWQVAPQRYALCTVHRAENTDDPARLLGIHQALTAISADCPVLWPVHPRTRKLLAAQGIDVTADSGSGIRYLEPLGYLEMQRLQMDARVILTDSGGVQKEAFFHRVPCITLRDETEWVETVAVGANVLVGANRAAIEAAFASLRPVDSLAQPYGTGQAAQRIAALLQVS